MKLITIEDVSEARRRIAQKKTLLANLTRQVNKDILETNNFYRERIAFLKNEEQKIVDRKTAVIQEAGDNTAQEIKPDQDIIQEAAFLSAVFNMKHGNLGFTDKDVLCARGATQFKHDLGYVFPYAEGMDFCMKGFIIGNTKPKNKYSLIIFGKTNYPKSLFKPPYDYGTALQSSYTFQMILSVRDAAEAVTLVNYYKKHKDRICSEIQGKYLRLDIKIQEARKNYTVDFIIPWMIWRCPECGNYYTEFDGAFAENYTPSCYRRESHTNGVDVKMETTQHKTRK